MSLSYDVFTNAFLLKITEYDFINMDSNVRTDVVDSYMKAAIVAFKKNCKYDFSSTADDELREFSIDIRPEDLDEITEIISEGMLVQWMKPFINHQDDLESFLNTRDFTMYSPAELIHRKRAAYKQAQKDFTQMIREYSFNHNDLEDLHI